MDHVAWDSTMSVGVEILDDDHKKLIGMLTVLLENGVASKNRDDLTGLLNSLLEYTNVHFAREEDLMERQGYPDLDAHKAAHLYFIDEVQKLSREYDESNTMMLRIDLILLLKEWLIEHIQSVDMRYKPFMAEPTGAATAH